MCEEYLSRGNGWLDHKAIYAGEIAVEVLASYGLVKPEFKVAPGLRRGCFF